MDEFCGTRMKRKLDQVEDDWPAPLNKRSKIDKNVEYQDKFFFSDLPPEIQHHILSCITSDHHRRTARLASKIWSEFINYNHFQLGLMLESETKDLIRYFSRYEKPIGLKFTKVSYLTAHRSRDSPRYPNLIREDQILRVIENLTQLTSLDLPFNNVNVLKHLTNLQQLTLSNSIETIEDAELVVSLPHLTSLTVPSITFTTKFPSKLQHINCNVIHTTPGASFEQNTRLTSLTGRFEETDLIRAFPNLRRIDAGYGAVNPETAILLPYLEELRTTKVHEEPEFKNLTKLDVVSLFTQDQIKITNKLPKLKVLRCYSIDLEDCDINVMKSLESCLIQDDECNAKVLPKLNSEKITELTVHATEDNFDDFAKFTKLSSLKLILTRFTKTEPHPVPLTLLTSLILYYDTWPMQWMTGLPNLEDLSAAALSTACNELLDFEELQKLTRLRLRGSYYQINVKNLTNLVEMEIENGKTLKKPPSLEIHGLSTLTNLTSLTFNRYKTYRALKNWSDLASLTKLRTLTIDYEYEPNDGTNLVSLTNLTSLSYATNNIRSLDCLTRLTRLQYLRVVTDEEKYIRQNIVTELPFYSSGQISQDKKERDPIK